ncbi:hypothetical protein BASA81_008651 [Batrachochytrium salamandrivorans]|nr:hypothetical protein BASA81_008651 [Batrachochytrium salamandrivorans]
MATIPLLLLREAVGHVVVVELTCKDEYRGLLQSCEDSMNLTLSKVTFTSRVGKRTSLEQVYLRGSAIRLFVLPDALVNAPVLKTISHLSSTGAEATKRRTKEPKQKRARRM